MIDVKLKVDLSKSRAYYREALEYAPGGAPDGKGWGENTIYVQRAKGAHFWDLDGNEFIDYLAGAGPMILGHRHDEVDQAAIDTIRNHGAQFAQPHTLEVELSKKLREIIPNADRVAFLNAGTDTLQVAVRVARTYTGRPKVVKFEGGYHGWADGLATSNRPSLELAGPASHPNAVADTSGVLPAILENIIVLPYNNLDAASECFEREKDQIACVIVEGIIHGHCIHPKPGFLEGLVDLCHSCGIPLVLDEIITGFRHDLGGLQRKWKIDADIAVYGKAMANGYVISAITGKKKYMETLTPGPALLSGTYNGNPLSCAASLKTIEVLSRPGFYERLFQLGDSLRDGINREVQRLGINALCYGYGSVWGLLFDRRQPENYREVLDSLASGGWQKFGAYSTHMLNHGIFLQPSVRRQIRNYIYGAHTEKDIQSTIDATAAFLKEHRADLK